MDLLELLNCGMDNGHYKLFFWPESLNMLELHNSGIDTGHYEVFFLHQWIVHVLVFCIRKWPNTVSEIWDLRLTYDLGFNSKAGSDLCHNFQISITVFKNHLARATFAGRQPKEASGEWRVASDSKEWGLSLAKFCFEIFLFFFSNRDRGLWIVLR